ncbi:MAG: thiamine phosphate synthase [Elusimicrobia bacterium]|nr:thiamine phosphate synthase [Elusimicrobiota bacterium]
MKPLGNFNHGLYCIITEECSLGRNVIQVTEELIEAGVKIIQYREKYKCNKDKYIDCKKIRDLTNRSGTTFIVNDNVDIALAVEADGVHIGQDDIPIEVARRLAPGNFIIGVSTHSSVQARDAVMRGADYIGVGPIYSTKTKKDACDAVGLEYLDFVVNNINIPFVAIGGIKLHNLPYVLHHGAKCVSMVTEIIGAQDIQGRIKEAMNIFKHNSKSKVY